LIRSFEAGARAGEGMAWGSFQLQKLLIETAQQPGVDYLIITDEEGGSSPTVNLTWSGMLTGRISILPPFRGRVPLSGESLPAPRPDTFEVYRRFAPRTNPMGDSTVRPGGHHT